MQICTFFTSVNRDEIDKFKVLVNSLYRNGGVDFDTTNYFIFTDDICEDDLCLLPFKVSIIKSVYTLKYLIEYAKEHDSVVVYLSPSVFVSGDITKIIKKRDGVNLLISNECMHYDAKPELYHNIKRLNESLIDEDTFYNESVFVMNLSDEVLPCDSIRELVLKHENFGVRKLPNRYNGRVESYIDHYLSVKSIVSTRISLRNSSIINLGDISPWCTELFVDNKLLQFPLSSYADEVEHAKHLVSDSFFENVNKNHQRFKVFDLYENIYK